MRDLITGCCGANAMIFLIAIYAEDAGLVAVSAISGVLCYLSVREHR